MPCGNGMRALRALRTCQATASIPVIITSGLYVSLTEGKTAGQPDGAFSKPFKADQRLAVTGQVMEGVNGG